jgi:hypothetical protein
LRAAKDTVCGSLIDLKLAIVISISTIGLLFDLEMMIQAVHISLDSKGKPKTMEEDCSKIIIRPSFT